MIERFFCARNGKFSLFIMFQSETGAVFVKNIIRDRRNNYFWHKVCYSGYLYIATQLKKMSSAIR